MMIRILFFITVISAVSCAHRDKTFSEFREVWGMENRRLHETLRKRPGFHFPEYTKQLYLADMEKLNKDLAKFIRSSFEQVEVGTASSVFVVCVKSENVAMCDNSMTAFVDRIRMEDTNIDLIKLMDEIRGP